MDGKAVKNAIWNGDGKTDKRDDRTNDAKNGEEDEKVTGFTLFALYTKQL